MSDKLQITSCKLQITNYTLLFKLITVYLSPLLIITSCSYFEKKIEVKDRVARVNNVNLYRTDLADILPEKVSAEDSIILTKNYIENWIKQTLLLQNAEKNLSLLGVDIEKQLTSYRNSLIIYQYEKDLVRTSLDTVLSDSELQTYYDNHQKNFELKENIVRFTYLKLSKETPKINKVRNWFKSANPKDKNLLEEYCYQYAINFNLNDSTWYYFDDLLDEIPIKTYNEEQFLKNNTFFEIPDSVHVYLVNIKEFMIKESISPLEFERDNIKNIIINQRKLKLIKETEQKIYDFALKNNEFEIY